MTFYFRKCSVCGKQFILGHQRSVLRAMIFVADPRCNYLEVNCPHCGRAMRLFEPPKVLITLLEELAPPVRLYASAPDELQETRDLAELRFDLDLDAVSDYRLGASPPHPAAMSDDLAAELAYCPIWPDGVCPYCCAPLEYAGAPEASVWICLTQPALSYAFAACREEACHGAKGIYLFLPPLRLAELSAAGVRVCVFGRPGAVIRRLREEHCRISIEYAAFRGIVDGFDENDDEDTER